jgi:hypothetical protein
MYKLSELLEMNLQPGEVSKMKNFLKRGTIDQTKIMEPYDNTSTNYSKQRGTIAEDDVPFTVDHPENKQKVVGWSWDEADTIDGDDNALVALTGRELQTLQDVKKIISRLLYAGYTMHEIGLAINTYIRSK